MKTDAKKPRGWRLADFTDAELSAFEVEIGALSLRLPLVAAMMGHTRPFYTVRDYAKTEGMNKIRKAAVEFLRDLHGTSTKEILAKWYREGAEAALTRSPPLP